MSRTTLLLLFVLLPVSAFGCFGPKLYIATGDSYRQQAFYALVSIYIKEKTGTDSVLVARGEADPGALIAASRADLEIVDGNEPAAGRILFRKAGLPFLLSGSRPLEDLQFSLIPRALDRLCRQLTVAQFDRLVARIAQGEAPMAVAREFLRQQDWL
ncbi:hypothetical protein EDC39_102141 [Geothermobacter ehrlichii]|uniref:ABC-type glycine betaine transport system substrate-binding domain-containing protein n=1 Tax=Geothermobacter ehrlichii TaxID=213224 RepID=A0A5D3WNF2_9BACT|nr:hypothetical protein [Geothermobacter ehrlichii]TYO99618.1 hypothetical protein EDC39_102141 [Geothermobacter ehrlichii]